MIFAMRSSRSQPEQAEQRRRIGRRCCSGCTRAGRNGVASQSTFSMKAKEKKPASRALYWRSRDSTRMGFYALRREYTASFVSLHLIQPRDDIQALRQYSFTRSSTKRSTSTFAKKI